MEGLIETDNLLKSSHYHAVLAATAEMRSIHNGEFSTIKFYLKGKK
jgi:hypothetical protein